jgi:hypothetical protein
VRLGLCWPKLDIGAYIPALLQGTVQFLHVGQAAGAPPKTLARAPMVSEKTAD